jgi:hypothetical protein
VNLGDPAIADACGGNLRQLELWTRQGAFGYDHPGQGHSREYDPAEIRLVARLAAAGATPLTRRRAVRALRHQPPGRYLMLTADGALVTDDETPILDALRTGRAVQVVNLADLQNVTPPAAE